MRRAPPLTLDEWLTKCLRLTNERDLDNVILLTGEPGSGKSTLMYQLGRAFDPRFDRDRIHFTVDDFIKCAQSAPKGSAVAADELLLNRRKAMTKEAKSMVDFLQVCRGLNLHLLLCFPQADRLDSNILDDRIRYRIDIMPGEDEKRLAVVSQRHYVRLLDSKGQEAHAVQWRSLFQFRFARNVGPAWEDYLAKKLLAARARKGEGSQSGEPFAPPGPDVKPPGERKPRLKDGWRGSAPRLVPRKTSPLYVPSAATIPQE